MTTEEHARIRGLARQRGERLLETGVLERKQGALRALGWPDAVRQVRETRKAS